MNLDPSAVASAGKKWCFRYCQENSPVVKWTQRLDYGFIDLDSLQINAILQELQETHEDKKWIDHKNI